MKQANTNWYECNPNDEKCGQNCASSQDGLPSRQSLLFECTIYNNYKRQLIQCSATMFSATNRAPKYLVNLIDCM